MKKTKREKFLAAVQLLAPENPFIIQVAQRVSEADLPSAPGAAALELVAHLESLANNTCPVRTASHYRCAHRARASSSAKLHCGYAFHRAAHGARAKGWNASRGDSAFAPRFSRGSHEAGEAL
jgi:hypothetical protein